MITVIDDDDDDAIRLERDIPWARRESFNSCSPRYQ
jgi:hypothetical protein